MYQEVLNAIIEIDEKLPTMSAISSENSRSPQLVDSCKRWIYYCEEVYHDFGGDYLIKALKKSIEDVKQGRVRSSEQMLQQLKNTIDGVKETEDRDRITGYVDIIARVWNKHPDLRFGQLVQYVCIFFISLLNFVWPSKPTAKVCNF